MGIFEALKACKRILCMQQANSEVFGESIAAQKNRKASVKEAGTNGDNNFINILVYERLKS